MKKTMRDVYEEHAPDQEKIRMGVLMTGEKRAPVKRSVLAVCLSLCLLVSCAAVMVSCDIKEYNDALAFFEENNIPTEGLSRGTIKKVYRDIKTEQYDYSDLAEIIDRTIGGYDIGVTNMNTNWNGTGVDLRDEDGFYLFEEAETDDASLVYKRKIRYSDGAVSLISTYLRKFDGEKRLWEAELSEFDITGCVAYGGKTVVYGSRAVPVENGGNTHVRRPEVAVLDKTGEVIWRETVYSTVGVGESGYDRSGAYVSDAIVKDEEIVLFIRSSLEYLCIARFSHDGEELGITVTHLGNYGIYDAAVLGDDYLVRIGNASYGEETLVKVSAKGEILGKMAYSSDDTAYAIQNMRSYGGKVYLSAYAYLREKDSISGREIAPIIRRIYEKGGLEYGKNGISSDPRVTEYTKEHYTAVLLVCDGDSVTPQTFYEVKGAFGGKLFVNEKGELVWNAEKIVGVYFSPATSAYSLGGVSRIYRYTFGENGALLDWERTEALTGFTK